MLTTTNCASPLSDCLRRPASDTYDILRQMPSYLLRPPLLRTQPVIIMSLMVALIAFNIIGFLPTARGYEVSKAAHNISVALSIIITTVLLFQLAWSPKLEYLRQQYFSQGRLPSLLWLACGLPACCGCLLYACVPLDWRRDRENRQRRGPSKIPPADPPAGLITRWLAWLMLWNPLLRPIHLAFRETENIVSRLVLSIVFYVAFAIVWSAGRSHSDYRNWEEPAVHSNSLRWVNTLGITVELCMLLLVRSNVEFLVRKLRLPPGQGRHLRRASITLSQAQFEAVESQLKLHRLAELQGLLESSPGMIQRLLKLAAVAANAEAEEGGPGPAAGAAQAGAPAGAPAATLYEAGAGHRLPGLVTNRDDPMAEAVEV